MAATFRISIILLALGSISGCKSDKAPAPAASASAKPVVVLPGADPALVAELTSIADTCKIAVESSSVSCPKAENRKLANQYISKQRPRAGAVATLAAALGHPDQKVRVVSANILYSAFRSTWADAEPGSVKAADADALLEAAFQAPKAQARQTLPAAVHAAALAGRSQTLETALAKTTDPEYKTIAYRHLMAHGRLSAFEQIKTAAKSDSQTDVLAALESPRNMQAWTAEEQSAVCPWAAEFLADKRPSVASRAASLLGNCGGEFVDKLIVKGEEALKSQTFTTADVAAYRELCGPRKRGQPNGPTEEQCTRARKLLEKALETSKLEVQVRTTALTTLAYQWPDDATLKLAKKLEKNPDKVLAEQATRTVQRLEQRSAVGSPSGRPPFAGFPPGLGSARAGALRRFPGSVGPTIAGGVTPGAPRLSAPPAAPETPAQTPATPAPAAPAQ